MDQNVSENITEKFVGTWKLVSTQFHLTGGQVIYPFGENAEGLLIYDDKGFMSAQIMRPGRPDFESEYQTGGKPDEIKAAFEGFVAYYSTYEVDSDKHAVVHHVLASAYPNWIGKDQIRFFEFSGNQLTLKTPHIKVDDSEIFGILTWERIGSFHSQN